MKQLLTILLILLLSNIVYADDAAIVHQSYGNTHQKWKNRLEADSHNVTSGTSLPSSISGYEMLIDIRYSAAISSADETKMETVLENDGTVVLIGEHQGFTTRNNSIQSLLRQWTGDNTIVYSTTSSIGYSGDDEQLSDVNVLSSLPGNWAYFNVAAAGVISNLGAGGCLLYTSDAADE